ncbi:hypothetical protein I3843_07G150600 [Carya illinoinensis]|uniref:Uncharacterized protein n=1 Tax=Carya illinoinensis TaxID=32201 RepID=A0A922EJI2_CARIL|nr:hypothetical protein I3760_07G150900 [Carya illinoinensis]KAG6704914.1 hypothetical protein I3842_07G155600 [Carya illinoinensis]KAG7971750.1 hypothetical protein I3843_07G150600 [Carya illinoinensis]
MICGSIHCLVRFLNLFFMNIRSYECIFSFSQSLDANTVKSTGSVGRCSAHISSYYQNLL